MKNKNFTRFLCFFMCFCLCFAWFGPPIEAKAAGGIIGFLGLLATFMAAHGAGLAASGAADSLRQGLEGWVADYISYVNESGMHDWSLSDWVDQIMDNVVINNAGYFALGAVAVKHLNDFMEWLTGNILSDGSSVGLDSFTVYHCPIYKFTTLTDQVLDTSVVNLDADGNISSVMVNSYIDTLYSGNGDTLQYQLSGKYYSCYKTASGYTFSCNTSKGYYGTPGDGCSFETNLTDLRFTIAVDNKFPNETAYRPVYFILLNSNNDVVFYYVFNSYVANTASYTFCESTVSYSSENAPDLVDSDSIDFSSLVLNTGTLVADDPTNKDDYSSSIFGAIVSGDFSSTREVVSNDVIENPSVTVPPIESDGTIEGNVSGIFSGVQALIELIKSIPSLILDGIKSIFIPDPDDMNNLYVGLLDEVNEKYGFDFDMGSLFGSEKQPDDITGKYSVGPLSWNLTFVSWGFLIDAVAALRPYIRGWLILMLVFYNMKQFGMLFNIDGLIGGMSPSEWNSAMTPKVVGDFSLNGAYKGGKK